jgi:hypothetical protein
LQKLPTNSNFIQRGKKKVNEKHAYRNYRQAAILYKGGKKVNEKHVCRNYPQAAINNSNTVLGK